MKIIPAIDLLEGKAVRLEKGKRDRVTVYSEEPWRLVRDLAAAGAERIHVVDLDGAFSGERAHRRIIERMLADSPVPVEVGGGLRNQAALDALFAAGAGFAVLGTAATKSPDFAAQACAAYPGQIIIAVDALDGVVAVEGWTESAEISAVDLAQKAADWGAAAVLYTDISRDGMHTGPNVEATRALHQSVGESLSVIASGGVTSLDDLRALAAAGIPYVVVGRALYDRHFTLEEAISAAAC